MATLSRRELTDANRRATERALLDATIALLEEGAAFADISIEQIVKRAGFSRPTFYAYFRDKRDIVLRLGRDLEAAVAVAADPWLRDGVGDIRPTLAAVLDAFRAHRAAVAATVEAATYDPEVASSWARFHDDFRATAVPRIAAAFPDLPAARVEARAFALVWMTERTLTEALAGADVDEEALLDELSRFWEVASAS